MDYLQARDIATAIKQELQEYCVKILIAGSIRRLKPQVKDIEIVAQPINVPQRDLFGDTDHYPLLDYLHGGFIKKSDTGFEKRRLLKGESRYFQFALIEGIALDLFVVLPPAQWGVIATLRTGPADFSRKLVTAQAHNGLMPPGFICKDGAFMTQYSKQIVTMNDENDVFKFIGKPFIDPSQRL